MTTALAAVAMELNNAGRWLPSTLCPTIASGYLGLWGGILAAGA